MDSQPKIRELHQSEISTFLKCGRLWYFRYVMGLKIPPRGALTVGRAVDAAVSVNFAQKIQSGEDLPVDDVLDACATEFEREKKDTDWRDSDPAKEKDTAIACAKTHRVEIAPKIQPATVQEKFVLETDAGFHLGGTIDLTTKDGWVRDTKTAARKGMNPLTGSIQAGIYDFAFEALRGKKAKGFGFDVVTKTKTPQVEIVEGPVTAGHREFTFDTIQNVHKAMQAGIALPAPETAYWCSPTWCGFWEQCRGKK